MNLNYEDRIANDLYFDDAMAWSYPQYTKKAVGRAGETLINESSEEKCVEALVIVNNWRSSHALPLKYITSFLRAKTKQVDKEALISQRLKRISSIKKKLQNTPGMQLHRIQDIG